MLTLSTFIYLSCFHLYFILGALIIQDGAFLDDFLVFNSSFWIRENGTLHCTSHRLNACAVTSWKNFAIVKLPQVGALQSHTLAMWLRNDCMDLLAHSMCCQHNHNRCTDYTTAKITSRRHYSFGRYAFMARVSGSKLTILKGSENNLKAPALICFSLKRKHCYDCLHFETSICTDTRDTRRIQTIFVYGANHKKKFIDLQFDISGQSLIYGIDVKPEGVQYFVGASVVASILLKKSSNARLPPLQLVISVALRPLPTDIGYLPNSVTQIVHMYRVGFVPAGTDPPFSLKDEMFVTGKDSSFAFPIFAIGSCAVFFMLFFATFQKDRGHISDEGYRMLSNLGIPD